MKVIYKYLIAIEDYQQIDMPEEAKIISLQIQNDMPCIWVEVDTSKRQSPRPFFLYGTGQPIGDISQIHIGSFQLLGGKLVYHLYEPA